MSSISTKSTHAIITITTTTTIPPPSPVPLAPKDVLSAPPVTIANSANLISISQPPPTPMDYYKTIAPTASRIASNAPTPPSASIAHHTIISQ